MATSWGALQIMHTANFRADFKRVITNGACDQTILNVSYWNARRWAEATSLSLNGLALMISCALTWKLVKVSSLARFHTPFPHIAAALWLANIQTYWSLPRSQ
jgi:hypothetical protein